MRRSVIWFVLLSVIAALVVLSMRQPEGAGVKLGDPDFASLLGKIGFLVLVGGAAMTLFRERFVQAIQWALLWVVFGLMLVVGYTYRFELRDTASRVMAEFMPGHAITRGGVVELTRSRTGDFHVYARINGAPVAMVFDTGASAVVLTQEAAKAAGLPTEFIRYDVKIDTANGRAQAAAVTLDRIAVGNIIERGVPALIAPPGQLKTSLLGMSFLNRLEGWEVRNGRLMLRARPET